MIADGVIGFLKDTLSNNSGNLNRGKIKPNGYEPLAQAAKQISQNFSTAEEKTVSALAAINPNDQSGRVLKKTALLTLKKDDEIPNLTKEEAKIAEAFFKARMLIQTIEKNACNLTQNLLGEEAPIGQIAAGRLRAISHKEQMSPPLPLLDPVTPEGVVQIGKVSLAEAIKANMDALVSLKLAVEPQEIPPILRALIDAISPKAGEELSLINKGSSGLSNALGEIQRIVSNPEKKINNQILPKIPVEVDSITGLTAGSSNPTQDSLTLPEAVPQEINGSLDRIAELPKI